MDFLHRFDCFSRWLGHASPCLTLVSHSVPALVQYFINMRL
jgi:hypothetical protein